MIQTPSVTDNIYYVGVNDRSKSKFEQVWTLTTGVSYNSYLIIDEKVCLIDTVDICYSEIFFRKIDQALGDREIDYLVINHMEPDHGGSIGLLKQRYPNIQIIGNKKTFAMLEGYHGIAENLVEVRADSKISLGKHELSFIMAPMVHWPEVMFTYVATAKLLFSADAFGTFGALDGHILDRDFDLDRFWPEMQRYYACIVGKYGPHVQKVFAALKALDLKLDFVCPTHGPIWTKDHFHQAADIYERFSRYEGEEGVVIVFGSMYGNTEVLADVIAQAVASAGIKNVICHSITQADPSVILRDIFRYKGLIIGSPTYCNGIFTPIRNLMEMIEVREIKDRFFSVFGSCSWAGQAVKKIVPFAETMKWELVGEPVEMKMSPSDETLEKGHALGKAMAERLISERA